MIENINTVYNAKIIENIFRESIVNEKYWEKKINYQIDNSIKQHNVEKISFLKLFKKYLSKKFRSFYR